MKENSIGLLVNITGVSTLGPGNPSAPGNPLFPGAPYVNNRGDTYKDLFNKYDERLINNLVSVHLFVLSIVNMHYHTEILYWLLKYVQHQLNSLSHQERQEGPMIQSLHGHLFCPPLPGGQWFPEALEVPVRFRIWS